MAKVKVKVKKCRVAYTREDAYQTLDMVNTAIERIDTKVSIALAVVGVLIGSVFAVEFPDDFRFWDQIRNLEELSVLEVCSVLCVACLFVSGALALTCFVLAILSRSSKDAERSVFFFGSISKMKLDAYRNRVNRMNNKQLLLDIEKQIHLCSEICVKKSKWYNAGLWIMSLAILLWIGWIALYIL